MLTRYVHIAFIIQPLTLSDLVLGISLELSPVPNPTQALQSYLSTIPLVRSLSSFPFPLPPYLLTSPAQPSRLPFETHREVHRHIATSLCRASIISSRLSNAILQTLRILRTFHAYSTSWPAGFRPRQRQRMLQLYLRALLAGYPSAGAATDSPYLADEVTVAASTLSARSTWRKEVSEAIRIGRILLSTTTTFPRAGSINAPVTAFTHLCVSLANKCPLLSREVISVLWWAQTLTFQSHLVLRHLTRLLAAVGDSVDARRTFELYVQLVLKARQTQQPEVSLQLKRRATDGPTASPQEIERQASDAEDMIGPEAESRKTQIAEAESDTQDEFIEALLVGARLLLQDLDEAGEAWRYVALAGDVVENGDRTGRRVPAEMRAQVEECKGIVRMHTANIRNSFHQVRYYS